MSEISKTSCESSQTDSSVNARLKEQEHRHCVRFIAKRFSKQDHNFGVDVNVPDDTIAAITSVLRSVSKSILTEALLIDRRETAKRQKAKKHTITKSVAAEAIQNLGLAYFANTPTDKLQSDAGEIRQIHSSFLEQR
eukprot:m.334634 g.334634  ORF g.334634 m.334634 type:complete len:137 (+) comp20509_c0_seq8:165-575(+)